MDIRNVDLNLLVALHAMAEHRSVTRAAEAIGLSQPAMSAAVARLRVLFGDPLFVKAGQAMQPTPRALALAEPVRRVMETLRGEILQAEPFAPDMTGKVFTVAMPDIAEVHFLPRLLERFAQEAPGARLRTLALPRHTAAQALESGDADLAIGYLPDLRRSSFFQQRLFRNAYVCILRARHPLAGNAMTLKQYLAASHVVVAPDGREHVFEQVLAQRGVQRRVLLELSHFMSLLPIVARTDLLATVPQDLAAVCAAHADIRVMATPFKSPTVEVHQYWHRRLHKDPASAWLRGLVLELFRA